MEKRKEKKKEKKKLKNLLMLIKLIWVKSLQLP
jgi:hypothetical protein